MGWAKAAVDERSMAGVKPAKGTVDEEDEDEEPPAFPTLIPPPEPFEPVPWPLFVFDSAAVLGLLLCTVPPTAPPMIAAIMTIARTAMTIIPLVDRQKLPDGDGFVGLYACEPLWDID